MSDFVAFLTDLGALEPQTLLQSGNFVFRAEGTAEFWEQKIQSDAGAKLGLQTEFYVRSVKDWCDLLDANPFPGQAASEPAKLLCFVSKTPISMEAAGSVAAKVAGQEQIIAACGALFVYYPIGQGQSKLDRTPGWRPLVARATGRNWNTMTKLRDMAT
jgi:uncharacterized protein (DUF1697 family)